MICSNPSNIFEALVPILCEHTGLRSSEIQPSMRLREDLHVDSLALHGILMSVEDHFGTMPDVAVMAQVKSVTDLAEAISAQVRS